MKIQIFHNILWASYKGAVFSELHLLARMAGLEIDFVQVAETQRERIALGSVDLSFHQYPYVLLFRGNFKDIPWFKRAFAVGREQRRALAKCIVVNSYDDFSSWVLLIQGKLMRQKIIVSLDSTYYDHRRYWLKEFVKRLFIHGCDGAFCYGTRSREYLISLGMDTDRITIRCQATPMDRLQKMQARLDLGRWNAPKSSPRPYFLFVGRLAQEKGLFDLIRAFGNIASESNFDLVLLGDGPLALELQEFARDLRLEEKVLFVGAKTNELIVAYYSEAYYLVLPSTSEPWGLVVNEAFALGCPAIVSDVCGCVPDLIRSETGYQFQAGNVDDLTNTLKRSISDAGQRDEKGTASLKLISEYTPKYAAEQMLAALQLRSLDLEQS